MYSPHVTFSTRECETVLLPPEGETVVVPPVPEYNAYIPLEGDILSYVQLKFSPDFRKRALIDTGACANAIPKKLFEYLQRNFPEKIGNLDKSEYEYVRLASGKLLPVNGEVQLKFNLANIEFEEIFLVLPTMNSMVLGNPFFKNHDVGIYPSKNILNFPSISMQVNEIKLKNGKRKNVKSQKYKMKTTQKYTLRPQEQIVVSVTFTDGNTSMANLTGTVIPNHIFEDNLDTIVSSSLSTISATNTAEVAILNLNDHPITIPRNTEVAEFKILNALEIDELVEIEPSLIALDKFLEGQVFNEINQLMRVEEHNNDRQPPRPSPDYDKIWFPTPETCDHPERLSHYKYEFTSNWNIFKNSVN